MNLLRNAASKYHGSRSHTHTHQCKYNAQLSGLVRSTDLPHPLISLGGGTNKNPSISAEMFCELIVHNGKGRTLTLSNSSRAKA